MYDRGPVDAPRSRKLVEKTASDVRSAPANKESKSSTFRSMPQLPFWTCAQQTSSFRLSSLSLGQSCLGLHQDCVISAGENGSPPARLCSACSEAGCTFLISNSKTPQPSVMAAARDHRCILPDVKSVKPFHLLFSQPAFFNGWRFQWQRATAARPHIRHHVTTS